MRALKKIAGATVAAIIVVVTLLLILGIPSGFVTSAIQARVERDTGYRLTINGAARIGLFPQVNVTLNDVTLADPRDRENGDRLTVGSIQADMTLESLWSGKPEIGEIVITRPVLHVPLLRERTGPVGAPAKQAASPGADAGAPVINRVTVIDGTIVFSNLRDRVENRIEAINAKVTIGGDRTIGIAGDAKAGEHPLKFAIRATAPEHLTDHQNIPVELTLDAPGALTSPLSAKAEVRLNGTVLMVNGVSGTLGEGAFNGWASADLASKPLVKLDLDFQRLDIAASARVPQASGQAGQQPSQPWSNASIGLGGLNYVDAQIRVSAAELNFGQARLAPAEIDATLAGGVLKARFSNLGAYGGQASGDVIVDASSSNPAYTLRSDLSGVRALPLLKSLADFDKLDGKLQAKLALRSSGISQHAIMANLDGTVFAVFQDGAIKGLNVAQMIRSLTARPLEGWQEGKEQATDLTQFGASFRVEKGQATTTDLNLVGPLVRMTGAGTIDLAAKSLAFRVEPKLVMTTEGQGRSADPVGLGIPVVIDGPWSEPRIYPDMQGILDNPDAAYAMLKDMGKGLFGAGGAGLGGLGSAGLGSGRLGGLGSGGLSGLIGGGQGSAGQGGDSSTSGMSDPTGGKLGETLGNLLQQGLGQGLGQNRAQGRSIPPPAARDAATPATPAPAPQTQSESIPQPTQDSQPMNDVLRNLFNR